MRLTTCVLAFGAVLGLFAPSLASAQTYYYNYPYNQYPYQYQQYPYTYGYQYPYNYGYNYYYGTPNCSIQYQYINNGYWGNGTYHQPIQLTWSSTGAYSAYISSIGTVNATGQQVVYPSGNTTYTMTVYGPGGSNTCYTGYSQPAYQYNQYPYNYNYGYYNNYYPYNNQYYYPYGNYQYGQYYYNYGSCYPYSCY